MPAASFDPNAVRAHLKAMAAGQYPELLQGYRRYYGIDEASLGAADGAGFGVLDNDTGAVVYQCWQPQGQARGTLLLVHGYFDHMGLYRHVIAWALAQGLAVLAFDLPGHGLSEGSRANCRSFVDYQGALARVMAQGEQLQLPAPWHLCGQSLGGAIVLDYLLLNQVAGQIGQILLLAPLVHPWAWQRVRLSYYLLRPFVRQIPRHFNANSNDDAFLRFLAQEPLQAHQLPSAWVGALLQWVARIEQARPSQRRPLIVQGDGDHTVDWRFNLDFLRRHFDAPQILMLPGARHHLANETQAIRSQYLDFWVRHL